MIGLLADAPSGPHAAELAQFGRLAGLWQTSISAYPADGSPARHADGAWEFGYALGGRAVIDVWQVPNLEIGLCVRIWDPRLQLWRFTFHGTARGEEVQMFGRQVGDEMVLERAAPGQLLRWTFSDIGADSFAWRSEISTDGGGSWRLEQEVAASR